MIIGRGTGGRVVVVPRVVGGSNMGVSYGRAGEEADRAAGGIESALQAPATSSRAATSPSARVR